MKKKTLMFVVSMALFVFCFCGLSYADVSVHMFNGIYFTMPEPAVLLQSYSDHKVFLIDGKVTVSVPTTSYPLGSDGIYNIYSNAKEEGYLAFASPSHGVNVLVLADQSKSNPTFLLVPYTNSRFSLVTITQAKGDSAAGKISLRLMTEAICKHNFSANSSIAPSCVSDGYSNVKKCTICGYTEKSDRIPALGHKEVIISGKAATCTETGLTDGKKCFVCGTITKAQTTIAALGHKSVVIPGKEASQTETGLTDGEKCSVCGLVLKEQKVIPKIRQGLCLDNDGIYRLYKDSALDMETYGIVEYGGGRFFVANGQIAKQDGLISDGINWYYVAQGQVVDYTGLALYDNEWFFVANGVLDVNRAGIVTYDGSRFIVGAGRKLSESNGLIQDPNTGIWYYVSAGQVADYTGLAEYDGEWFYVKDGELQVEFTGDVEYDGSLFYVLNGHVIL